MMELTVRIEDPEVEELLAYLDAYPRAEQYALMDRARQWLDLTDKLFYPFIQEAADVLFCRDTSSTSGRNPHKPSAPDRATDCDREEIRPSVSGSCALDPSMGADPSLVAS